jgi:hypothetical protein
MASPPPPPPHGGQHGPGGGLPPGKYDIFVIPPHSSGSGFLYLPSLQPHRNSFLAGVACTLAAMAVWTVVFPAIRDMYHSLAAGGGIGVLLMMGGVGVAGWAWGKTQLEGGNRSGSGTDGAAGGAAGPGAQSYTGSGMGGAGAQPGNMPGSQSTGAHTFGGHPQTPPPKPSWQRTKPAAGTESGTPKGAWEKAREEARKREQERKRAEELRKKADELLKKREMEEKEKTRAREKEARERREREAREKSTYQSARTSPKRPPNPTARTEADEDAFSYRPYDKPKPAAAHTSSSSAHSEFSYAHSHSTRASTPPPTRRGPYATKDPDKIVIKAVYAFNHAFNNLPVAQLVSGSGAVTDGLILRITTEGLFIDDDVRGVPQREWDVKAWTMKLVEVWCPKFHSACESSSRKPASTAKLHRRGGSSDADALLVTLLSRCRSGCYGQSAGAPASSASYHPGLASVSASLYPTRPHTNARNQQSGELRGLHVLRATIRDQEGKRYVFVLPETEGWKVAVGLQRLRRGTQVRALGVSGLPQLEVKAILENMGFL